MALLSQADRDRIAARVGEVEKTTAGEIVIVDAMRSDDYGRSRLLVAVSLAVLMVWFGEFLWPNTPALWMLAAQLPLAAAWWAVLGVPALLRIVAPSAEQQTAVESRALRLFTERGVFNTRDRSGVLLLLSELEHRVVMLGDEGIHERVHTDGWDQHVQHIVAAIRAGRAADGVCEVLDTLGATLAENFPPREDDTNELPNEVVEDSA